MERVEREPFRLGCPCFADELVGREATQALQPATEVVGVDEVVEVAPELLVAVVMVAPDGRVLDGPVHPLDLAVRPRVVDPGAAVFDPILPTAHGEHVRDDARGGPVGMARREAELDALSVSTVWIL